MAVRTANLLQVLNLLQATNLLQKTNLLIPGGTPPADVALVAHTGLAGTSFGGVTTTNPIDTTGSSLIVVIVGAALSAPGAGAALTDSEGNTWQPLTVQDSDTFVFRMFYCFAPVTSASHTFTYDAGAFTTPTVIVEAFSGTVATGAVFESENGHGHGAPTIQPGAVTPGNVGDLIVSGVISFNFSSSGPIDSGFTVTDNLHFAPFTNGGGAMAYLIAPSTAAVNPTWTQDFSEPIAAVIVVFKHA